MSLKDINAVEAHALLQKDAVLVDVREPHEIASERIPGSIELPLSQLARGKPANLPRDKAVVFHCASGARTKNNGARWPRSPTATPTTWSAASCGWKRAGFQTTRG